MSDADANDSLVDELAEEFARRWRAGERPTVEEYAIRFPQWSAAIRDVFPAVLMMEECKPHRAESDTPEPISAPTLTLPDQIGDYRILREIGRGGMGVVYEAMQESLGRRVALKVLPGHLLLNEKLRVRFLREAQAAARLHHTNIVPVFGVGEHERMCFYVMQLIPGISLDHFLYSVTRQRDSAEPDGTVTWSHRPVPTQAAPPGADESPSAKPCSLPLSGSLTTAELSRTIARIGIQVADALAYAHRLGVLHRDIKPSNLLLDERGSVWVTDFGVAKLLEEANLTQSGDLVGTLKYMPPERFAGQSDARGDVYSLGITLYELLALRPAFPDTTPQHLIQLITHAAPPRLRALNPEIPADLETVILHAMAREPADRYATADELAEDLRRFLDDRPILARRAGVAEQVWRWCRRNQALATVTATAFVLMVAITIISLVAFLKTATANAETARANLEMQKALAAEQAQREHAETTSTLALGALTRLYDRFAPIRVVVTPQTGEEEGAELPAQPVLAPEAVPLLEELLRTYEQIAQSSREFTRLQVQAAEANHRIGDIRQRLGRFEDAVTAYRTAIDIYTRLSPSTAGDALHIKTARSYNELGRTLRFLQQNEEAQEMHARAIQTLTAAPRELAARPECRFELARTWYTLGQRELFLSPRGPEPPPRRPGGPGHERPPGPGDGRPRGWPSPPPFRSGPPEPHPAQQAVALLEQLVREYPSVPEYRHLLACCYRDAPPEGLPRMRPPEETNTDRAVDLLRQLVADFPKAPDYRLDLCETLGRMMPAGRLGGAERGDATRERLREAIALSADLVAQYPNVPQYTASHAQYHDRLGMALAQGHDLPEAEKTHRKAVALQSGLVKQYPQVVAYSFWLSLMECSLARVLSERGDQAEARARLESATDRLEALRKKDPRLMSLRLFLGMAYRELAQVHARSGETELAAQVLRKAENYGRGPGFPGPRDKGGGKP